MLALCKCVQREHPNVTIEQAYNLALCNVQCFYCGDDGLNFAYNAGGMRLLDDALEEWKLMPWDVKVEGRHVYKDGDYENTPSFISRKPVKFSNRWWHALDKPDKLVCKLYYQKNLEDATFGERLSGIEASLIHGLLLHRLGHETNPVFDWMDKNFGTFSRVPMLGAMLSVPRLEGPNKWDKRPKQMYELLRPLQFAERAAEAALPSSSSQ